MRLHVLSFVLDLFGMDPSQLIPGNFISGVIRIFNIVVCIYVNLSCVVLNLFPINKLPYGDVSKINYALEFI